MILIPAALIHDVQVYAACLEERELSEFLLFTLAISQPIDSPSGARCAGRRTTNELTLYPGTVHFPFLSMVSVALVISGLAFPTSSTCRLVVALFYGSEYLETGRSQMGKGKDL
jgi:hypothetical protein